MEDEELIQQIEWLQQAEDDERREEDQSWQVLLALAGAVIAGAELSAERRRFSQPTVCTVVPLLPSALIKSPNKCTLAEDICHMR